MEKKLTDIEINEKLISAFMNVLGTDMAFPISVNTEIEMLMLDSLDEVELVMNLEKVFNITIDDDYADFEIVPLTKNFTYIRDIKKILKEKYKIFDVKEDRKLKIINISK